MNTNPAPFARKALWFAAVLLGPTYIQAAPVQLTFGSLNDENPRWNPTTGQIVYQKFDGSQFQIGTVNSNGTGEGFLATGCDLSTNSCALSWITPTKVILAEAVNLFEDMTFDITGGFYHKTVANGLDGPFSSVQLNVPGGFNDGAFVGSRDGSTVLWRDAPNTVTANSLTIRTATYSSLIGQNSNAVGTVALTASNGVVGARGVCLNPNGTQFVIALPSGASGFDLWRYNSNGLGTPTQLTFTGGTNNDFNGAPDISPDGTTILFQHNSDIWTIGMNGSGLTQVTNTPGFEAAPSWAPNGADYAYMQLDGGGTDWNIYRNTVPAPEPASTGLAMLGGLALLLRRRRS